MGKELRSDIVIGGKADPSFYQLGSQIQALAGMLNQLSGKLIQFGKESTEAYQNYEDNLLDAQVALKTQYDSASQLGKVMNKLDQQAMSWANNTRFTTEDVSSAISNAAHAGWDLEKIMAGVPDAMNLAMAGGTDLSQALELLIDISNAAGVSFGELGDLTDYWAYAANKSSTTIPEMGQAMQKMGATLKYFKGDMAGVTTMLAVLANNGTKGAEAGTLLRNSVIRLIAPTKAAAAAMDGLELTDDDLEEIYKNADGLGEVGDMLEKAGFSAYDAEGNLKNFLTIFEELNKATEGMTEQDRNKVMSTIFPTRTITGALALLDAAKNKWDGLYSSIQKNGEGYAQYAADTMESGLGGSLRHLESVYNVLQTKTGKALSGTVEEGAGAISSLIESVNNMDEGAFQTIVGGLTGLAAVGPGLMALTSIATPIRLLTKAGMGPALAVTAVATAAAVAAGAVNAYMDAAEHASFGDLELDSERIQEGLDQIGAAFREGQAPIDEYTAAIEKAVEAYTDASSQLKGNLLESMLTGGKLTSAQKQEMYALGDQIREALIDGIQQNQGRVSESMQLFSGMDGDDLIDSGIWGSLMDTIQEGFQGAIAEAQSLSTQLRAAMVGAFADGELTGDEIDKIQKILDQQNELLAMQADAKNATERAKLMRKAQTLGLDNMNEISDMAQDQLKQELDSLEDDFWNVYSAAKLGGELKIKQGKLKADGTPYTEADLQAELETLLNGDPDNPYDGYEGMVAQRKAGYGSFLSDLYRSAIQGSDYSTAMDAMDKFVGDYLEHGEAQEGDLQAYRALTDINGRAGLANALDQAIRAMGGVDAIQGMAQTLAATGNLTDANKLQRMMLAYELSQYDQYGSNPGQGVEGKTFGGLYGPEDVTYPTETDTSQVGKAIDAAEGQTVEATVTADTEGVSDAVEAAGDQTVNATVTADTSQVSQAIDAAEGQTVEAEITGDPGPAQGEIASLDGQEVEVTVNADTGPAEAAINALNGMSVSISVSASVSGIGGIGGGVGAPAGFAEGGRATEASIFGEVPGQAEWAIPESHTQRTAELLDAARAASGFSWGELLSRNGGLQGGGRSIGTIVYSPTIHAQDSRGVERALKMDKKWLEKYLQEQQMRQELEGYA